MSDTTKIFFKDIEFHILFEILEEYVGVQLSRFMPFTEGISYSGSCFGLTVLVYNSHNYESDSDIPLSDYPVVVSFEHKSRQLTLELIDDLRVKVPFIVAELITLKEECEYIIVDNLEFLLKKYPD